MRTLSTVVYAFSMLSAAIAAEPPVIEAARSEDGAKLRSIVSAKDGLHARGSHNQTALHEAAARCNSEMAQLLVDAGVDRLVRDNSQRTAAVIAMNCPESTNMRQLVRLLRTPMAPTSPNEEARWSLQDAAARRNAGVIEMLLKMGSNVNAVGTKGNRALEIACRTGDPHIARMLLDHGADVRLKTGSGSTALHEAALGGNAEVVELLIARQADIDAADDESGATPLHYAASFGRVDVVKVLIGHGADIQRKNVKGASAMDLAITHGHDEVVKILRTPR